MVAQAEALTFQCTVPATPAAVFRAWTNAGALRDWLSDAAEADPRPGGRIYLWWNDGTYAAGTYTELRPDEGLTFTWQGPGAPQGSEVRVEIHPADAGSAVAVMHEGAGDAERIVRRWE